MNGDNKDDSYRYKLPMFNIIIAGKGNGIYTIFNNMEDISQKINHPSDILYKWIAFATGSNFISSRNTITGNHSQEKLKELILLYIKYMVMCPKCGIPETIPKIQNKNLILCCSACKNESYIEPKNKLINKAIDFIIKYFNNGGIWITTKGTMVLEEKEDKKEENKDIKDNDQDLYNPF